MRSQVRHATAYLSLSGTWFSGECGVRKWIESSQNNGEPVLPFLYYGVIKLHSESPLCLLSPSRNSSPGEDSLVLLCVSLGEIRPDTATHTQALESRFRADEDQEEPHAGPYR